MFEAILAQVSALRPVAWPAALVIGLATGVLIFAPESVLTKLGLGEFTGNPSPSVGLFFPLSVSVIGAELAVACVSWFRKWKKSSNYRKTVRHHLKLLSGDEKELMRQFIKGDLATINCPLSDGTANLLQSKGILTRSSNVGMAGTKDVFPFSIQPIARKHLLKKPQIIDL